MSRRRTPPRERGMMNEAIAITGYKPRLLQAMAAAGKIPGASKPEGARCWTFDLAMLRAWIKSGERQPERHPRAATGAGRSCGVEPRSPAGNTDGRYERMMSVSRGSAARRGASINEGSKPRATGPSTARAASRKPRQSTNGPLSRMRNPRVTPRPDKR
jgi:hypothetical protein